MLTQRAETETQVVVPQVALGLDLVENPSHCIGVFGGRPDDGWDFGNSKGEFFFYERGKISDGVDDVLVSRALETEDKRDHPNVQALRSVLNQRMNLVLMMRNTAGRIHRFHRERPSVRNAPDRREIRIQDTPYELMDRIEGNGGTTSAYAIGEVNGAASNIWAAAKTRFVLPSTQFRFSRRGYDSSLEAWHRDRFKHLLEVNDSSIIEGRTRKEYEDLIETIERVLSRKQEQEIEGIMEFLKAKGNPDEERIAKKLRKRHEAIVQGGDMAAIELCETFGSLEEMREHFMVATGWMVKEVPHSIESYWNPVA